MADPDAVKTGETEVFITRVFSAPRDLVFKFWTEPEHLATWFGPTGYQSPVEDVTIELRVGGRYQVRMVETATGSGHWMYGTIKELVPPELLVIAIDVPHPAGLPPVNVMLRVQFHDHGDRTVVRLHQGPFTTKEQVEETTAGWGQSFDTLDNLLATTGGIA